MTDRTTSQNTTEPDKNGDGDHTPDSRQTIFDARFANLTDGFGQACEQEGVQTAIAIAIHPGEKHPIVFLRGHEYDVTVLLSAIQRQLTRSLLAPLDPNYEAEE